MSKVDAVLLVPAEGDPHGLLREGPCGARPPKAIEVLPGVWREGWGAHEGKPGRRALVLAWGGKPVAEGCFRVLGRVGSLLQALVYGLLTGLVAPDDLRLAEYRDAGTLILLDADGQEVSDE